MKKIVSLVLLMFLLISISTLTHYTQPLRAFSAGSPKTNMSDSVCDAVHIDGTRIANNEQYSPSKGPRSNLIFYFYGNAESLFAALLAGDVDVMCYNLDNTQKIAAEADPDIQLAAYQGNEYFGYDLNNNYTIPYYPGVRNPLSMLKFRQALAFAVNKNYIVNDIVKGVGERIDVPIPATQSGWWNPSVTGENYPYEYNMTRAAELLDAAGFADTDGDGTRNYPIGWPGREDGPNLDPLKMYIKIDTKSYVVGIGYELHYRTEDLGIPTELEYATNGVASEIIFNERNYHIYTSVWTVKKYQPLYWFPMFHSMFCYPGGPNYVTGLNESRLPNYPDFDKALETTYHSVDLPGSMAACKISQEIFVDECISISLFSPMSYVAWRKPLVGVVNMFGYGLNNKYTYLNAYKVDGSPIRIGLPTSPTNLNPLYSPINPLAPDIMHSNWQILDECIYPHLINKNPYDLGMLQPWIAQDWEVDTWIDPNPSPNEPSEKTKITFYLRKDCGVVEPGTGNYIRNLNAHDVEFSIWYLYAFDDGWNWHSVMDVHHTHIVDDYTIEVYFDRESFWFLYAIGEEMPILPKYELIDILCRISSVSFDGPLPAGTQFKLDNGNEQIVQVTSDDMLSQYIVFGGYEDYEHNWMWILQNLPAGTYTINYYTPDLDPHGYYLAGLDWTQTWYSSGLYYPTGVGPGVGGFASFTANPFYFHETPPLGELDWRWIWDTPGGVPGPEIPGRDSGHYKIEIYDVVKATASYCHRGDGTYDPWYFPGADIDASDLCHIGIYDIVTITGKYGMEWGYPPP